MLDDAQVRVTPLIPTRESDNGPSVTTGNPGAKLEPNPGRNAHGGGPPEGEPIPARPQAEVRCTPMSGRGHAEPVASRAIGSVNEMVKPSGSVHTASRIPSFGCSVGGTTKRAPRWRNSAQVRLRSGTEKPSAQV